MAAAEHDDQRDLRRELGTHEESRVKYSSMLWQHFPRFESFETLNFFSSPDAHIEQTSSSEYLDPGQLDAACAEQLRNVQQSITVAANKLLFTMEPGLHPRLPAMELLDHAPLERVFGNLSPFDTFEVDQELKELAFPAAPDGTRAELSDEQVSQLWKTGEFEVPSRALLGLSHAWRVHGALLSGSESASRALIAAVGYVVTCVLELAADRFSRENRGGVLNVPRRAASMWTSIVRGLRASLDIFGLRVTTQAAISNEQRETVLNALRAQWLLRAMHSDARKGHNSGSSNCEESALHALRASLLESGNPFTELEKFRHREVFDSFFAQIRARFEFFDVAFEHLDRQDSAWYSKARRCLHERESEFRAATQDRLIESAALEPITVEEFSRRVAEQVDAEVKRESVMFWARLDHEALRSRQELAAAIHAHMQWLACIEQAVEEARAKLEALVQKDFEQVKLSSRILAASESYVSRRAARIRQLYKDGEPAAYHKRAMELMDELAEDAEPGSVIFRALHAAQRLAALQYEYDHGAAAQPSAEHTREKVSPQASLAAEAVSAAETHLAETTKSTKTLFDSQQCDHHGEPKVLFKYTFGWRVRAMAFGVVRITRATAGGAWKLLLRGARRFVSPLAAAQAQVARVFACREEFESTADKGMIRKEAVRWVNVFYSYAVLGAVGVPLCMLVRLVSGLAMVVAALPVVVLAPLFAVLGSCCAYLWSLLWRPSLQKQSQSECGAAPFATMVLHFCLVPVNALACVFCVAVAGLWMPLVVVLRMLCAGARFAAVRARDFALWHLVLRRNLQIPSGNSWACYRTRGPGIGREFFAEESATGVLRALQIRLDLIALSVHLNVAQRAAMEPVLRFKQFFASLFQSLDATASTEISQLRVLSICASVMANLRRSVKALALHRRMEEIDALVQRPTNEFDLEAGLAAFSDATVVDDEIRNSVANALPTTVGSPVELLCARVAAWLAQLRCMVLLRQQRAAYITALSSSAQARLARETLRVVLCGAAAKVKELDEQTLPAVRTAALAAYAGNKSAECAVESAFQDALRDVWRGDYAELSRKKLYAMLARQLLSELLGPGILCCVEDLDCALVVRNDDKDRIGAGLLDPQLLGSSKAHEEGRAPRTRFDATPDDNA
eukprot:CAMPEP_0185832790 /NCGR_PEP_ID=MMETSP1353-20130828/2294_1 /TAXON_ID=1077150 /ORGANISM="Erythrolobus australicus, Strain CCMP3124" /LENGTH=1138 /DNA_ID=CAMNT_0028531013 /DNA_START=378 /DNA_END=3794 /DNA_ORIENTATION=+